MAKKRIAPEAPEGQRGCSRCLRVMTMEEFFDGRSSGRVRELLCGTCNTALGAMRDSPELLIAAAWYLRRHKGKTGAA